MNLIECMRVFVAVVDSGSFTHAGRKLDMSKTLVSKKVQALENHLSARLLHRTTRSLSVTEPGRLLHLHCTRILDDLEELENLIHNQADAPRGHLQISAPTTFGEMFIASLMTDFRAAYPGISVDLNLTDRHVDLVDEGFDVAIRIANLPNSSLIARKLAPSPVHLCATPDYLKKHGRPAHPLDLADHQCIVDTNFRSNAFWPFREGSGSLSVPVSGAFSVNSGRAAKSFVLAGNGLALCPGFIVSEELKSGMLETVLGDFNAFDMNVYAIYNSRKNLAPKVRACVDFLVQRLGDVSTSW